jgi:hypothetical protein
MPAESLLIRPDNGLQQRKEGGSLYAGSRLFFVRSCIGYAKGSAQRPPVDQASWRSDCIVKRDQRFHPAQEQHGPDSQIAVFESPPAFTSMRGQVQYSRARCF